MNWEAVGILLWLGVLALLALDAFISQGGYLTEYRQRRERSRAARGGPGIRVLRQMRRETSVSLGAQLNAVPDAELEAQRRRVWRRYRALGIWTIAGPVALLLMAVLERLTAALGLG